MAHSFRPPRARLGTMLAVTGAAAAMTAWAASGAAAATPDAHGANARHSATPAAARPADAGAADTATTVTCQQPGTSHSIQADADLPDTAVAATWDKSDPTELKFAVKAQPQVSLNLNFSGDAQCEAHLPASRFPLGDTGLVLELTPKLDFSTTGVIGADFTWKPTAEAGFTIDHTKLVTGPMQFSDGSGIVLTGDGTASLRLDLRAVIENADGVAGVDGDFGPTITATVHGATADASSCWDTDVSADADFGTYVNSFGFTQALDQEWQLAPATSSTGCLAKTVVFDGGPGTGAPPATLGPYTMTSFAADPSAQGTVEPAITGPTGALAVSPALTHDVAGGDWATWNNSYAGDVYQDSTVLPDGNIMVTVTLPPGTGAFYAYAEPNEFSDYAVNATADNGVTSGNVDVDGYDGARYFGFYATCGHTVGSVTYIDSGGDTAAAIGQFGIAKAQAC